MLQNTEKHELNKLLLPLFLLTIWLIEIVVAFQVYDVDNDGFISNGDLFRVLKMMVEDNLKDYQLQQLVDKTIIYFDKDDDGKLSFKEFARVQTNTLLASNYRANPFSLNH